MGLLPRLSSPEEYLEAHFRLASDRALARRVGWGEREVDRFLRSRGLSRTDAEKGSIRDGTSGELPEFRKSAAWLPAETGSPSRWGIGAFFAAVSLAIHLPSYVPGVTGPRMAAALLDSLHREGWGLLAGPWPILSKAALLLPLGDAGLRFQLLSAALFAVSCGLGLVLLWRFSFRDLAVVGPILAFMVSAPGWSAVLDPGPQAMTPLLVLIAAHALLEFRRRQGWPRRWPSGALLLLCLLLLAIHLFSFPAGQGGSAGGGLQAVVGRFISGPSLMLGLLAWPGILFLRRLARGDVWLWALVAAPALLRGDDALIAPLLILPAAALLDGLQRTGLFTARRWAGAVVRLLLFLPGFQLCPRNEWRGNFIVDDYARGLLATLPEGSTLFATDREDLELVRCLQEAGGVRSDVKIEGALPPRGQLRADPPPFATFSARREVPPEFEARPHGPVLEIAPRGAPAPERASPWGRVHFRDSPDATGAPFLAALNSRTRRPIYQFAAASAAGGKEMIGWLVLAEKVAASPDEFQDLGELALSTEGLEVHAERLLEEARALDPIHAPSRRALARIAYRKQDFARALALVEEIRRQQPFGLAEILLLAEIAEAKGDAGGAIERYREAAIIAPGDHRPPRQLGFLYRKKGDRAMAEASFRKSLELNPNQPDLSILLDPSGRGAARPLGPRDPLDPLPPGAPRPSGAGPGRP